MMKFEIKKYKKARAGITYIQNYIIETPVFMPVGTLGTVKGISKEIFINIILIYY